MEQPSIVNENEVKKPEADQQRNENRIKMPEENQQSTETNNTGKIPGSTSDGSDHRLNLEEQRSNENQKESSDAKFNRSKKSVRWSRELVIESPRTPSADFADISNPYVAPSPTSINFKSTMGNVKDMLGRWRKKVGEASRNAEDLAANTWQHSILHSRHSAGEDIMTDSSFHRMDVDVDLSQRKTVECRICHDEDEDCNMEVPCSCRGSLKYAHRKCVQRWCNEKGDSTCEICQQQFKPGYTAPHSLLHYGGMPMNFRGNWEISRRDFRNPHFITMVSTDQNVLDPDFDNYYATTSRSLIYYRIVAITFMVLLVLRHTLPFILSAPGDYSITLFMLLLLRTIGILLPIYIMVRAFTATTLAAPAGPA